MNSLPFPVERGFLQAQADERGFRWIQNCWWTVIALLALPTFIFQSSAASSQLLSMRVPSLAQPASGNGDSALSWMSPDGRFIVFSSAASDLVPGDNGQFHLDVFLRDRLSNTTVLASANLSGTGGGTGDSRYGMASTNGQFVVFESDAGDLVSGDTNDVTDIFVRNLVAGTTALVSVATNGSPADGGSSDATMTPDGHYVIFVSSADNLVANDTNGIPDVFVRDLVAQTTTRVSVGAIPPSGTTNAIVSGPVITPDGHYVAFCSSARGLATGAPANSTGEIYVRNLLSNTTTWASTNAATIVSTLMQMNNMPSYYPRISDDGRYVAFECGTNSANIPGLSGPVNNPVAVLQYDSTSGTTTVVSTNGCSDWLSAFPDSLYDDGVYGLQMSPDGRFVAFAATNRPVAGYGVRLWDRQAGTDTLVSVCLDGTVPTNSSSCLPVVSPDGRYVAFLSDATNLTANAVSKGLHVYLRDLQVGTNWLVDGDTNGIGSSDEWGTTLGLSSNGQFVAFNGVNGSLVNGDQNRAFDGFVRDISAGTDELISQRNPAAIARTGNGFSSEGPYSISADGRWVAYASYATDLVTNDFNGNGNVFVSDLVTGSNMLASVGSDGNAAAGGDSYSPTISADGGYVVFASMATNLVAGAANGFPEIFLRDIWQGTNLLVSTNSLNPGSGESSYPVISADGRHVVFLLRTNTLASYPGTFWRDLNSGQTVMLAANSLIGLYPSISADGQYVTYFNYQSHLYAWNAGLAANVYTNTGTATSAAISPSGGRLLYLATNQLYVWDLIGGSNLFTCPSAAPIQGSSQWSSDGRFFVFATAASFVPGDNNGTNDVFLCDLQTGTVTLVSENAAGTGSANGPSDWPVISGDGRFVVFRSFATDLTSGINTTPGLFAFDRLTGSSSLLATGDSRSWTHWASQPAVTTNGTAVFQSWDSGLVTGDLNRSQDIFAKALSAVSIADSDGDGIPDWWMTKYFGHPTGLGVDHSLAQDDADGDGVSNLQEYIAGTDPTDPYSVFTLQIAVTATPQNVVLSWPGMAGRNYRVFYKNNLNDPQWLVAPGMALISGSQGSYTAPVGTNQLFYQVSVSL